MKASLGVDVKLPIILWDGNTDTGKQRWLLICLHLADLCDLFAMTVTVMVMIMTTMIIKQSIR